MVTRLDPGPDHTAPPAARARRWLAATSYTVLAIASLLAAVLLLATQRHLVATIVQVGLAFVWAALAWGHLRRR